MALSDADAAALQAFVDSLGPDGVPGILSPNQRREFHGTNVSFFVLKNQSSIMHDLDVLLALEPLFQPFGSLFGGDRDTSRVAIPGLRDPGTSNDSEFARLFSGHLSHINSWAEDLGVGNPLSVPPPPIMQPIILFYRAMHEPALADAMKLQFPFFGQAINAIVLMRRTLIAHRNPYAVNEWEHIIVTYPPAGGIIVPELHDPQFPDEARWHAQSIDDLLAMLNDLPSWRLVLDSATVGSVRNLLGLRWFGGVYEKTIRSIVRGEIFTGTMTSGVRRSLATSADEPGVFTPTGEYFGRVLDPAPEAIELIVDRCDDGKSDIIAIVCEITSRDILALNARQVGQLAMALRNGPGRFAHFHYKPTTEGPPRHHRMFPTPPGVDQRKAPYNTYYSDLFVVELILRQESNFSILDHLYHAPQTPSNNPTATQLELDDGILFGGIPLNTLKNSHAFMYIGCLANIARHPSFCQVRQDIQDTICTFVSRLVNDSDNFCKSVFDKVSTAVDNFVASDGQQTLASFFRGVIAQGRPAAIWDAQSLIEGRGGEINKLVSHFSVDLGRAVNLQRWKYDDEDRCQVLLTDAAPTDLAIYHDVTS